MKKIFFGILAISTITITSCNTGENKNVQEVQDMNEMGGDTTQHATATTEDAVKTIGVTYSNVDTKAAASMKEIVDHYLQIKNALANDKGIETAVGAKEMEAAISKLDKSLLTAEQKTAYDKYEEILKETAELMAMNGAEIKQQRLQMVMMSEGIYALVKNFGAGRPMYHDYCPMARDNQGAMWISEMKEIKNPYFGAEMPTCGTVEEVIQ